MHGMVRVARAAGCPETRDRARCGCRGDPAPACRARAPAVRGYALATGSFRKPPWVASPTTRIGCSLPLLDDDERALGMLHRYALASFLAAPCGHRLYANRPVTDSLDKDTAPVTEDTTVEGLSERSTDRRIARAHDACLLLGDEWRCRGRGERYRTRRGAPPACASAALGMPVHSRAWQATRRLIAAWSGCPSVTGIRLAPLRPRPFQGHQRPPRLDPGATASSHTSAAMIPRW